MYKAYIAPRESCRYNKNFYFVHINLFFLKFSSVLPLGCCWPVVAFQMLGLLTMNHAPCSLFINTAHSS
jgi:hypothetical protein